MACLLQHPAENRGLPSHHFQTSHLHQFAQFLGENYTLPDLLELAVGMLTNLQEDLQEQKL